MQSSLRNGLDGLNVWKRNGERAPHKPLLILLALGAFQRGIRQLPFKDYEHRLRELLREFGPSRRSYHPEYPFWRLQQDGLWTVVSDAPMESRQSNSDPTLEELRRKNATGAFVPALAQQIERDPGLIAEIALHVLASHFPASIHEDILEAVGLSLEPASAGAPSRDAGFRKSVLRAYEYRCAVCGLDLRINNHTIGLDAAHIRWHQAHGPDIESNGIALCTLHHKLFDMGAFTICNEGRLLVSEEVHGAGQFDEVLLRHHGMRIFVPANPAHAPAAEYLAWHRSQVFKGNPRYDAASVGRRSA